MDQWTAVRSELIRAQNTVKRLDTELKLKQAELQRNLQGEQLADLRSEIARLEKELTVHQAFVKRFEEDETKLRNHLKELKGSLLKIEELEREIASFGCHHSTDGQTNP